ncbi:hypothetical protein AVV13_gp49 [Streptomyces phage SF1]|uniref:Uncharacterized protein n=2 Tax=Caudoviricetes TaxID=2731619 RepID=A0A0K1Y5B1_9CAUD|nr:hypothetical protein [Streptomyces sp. SPB78]YP_009199297.1 hypothetical protein AVV13_gp49 [Streptomyces phage SF1]YP_009213156.1 hypothetical protein AVV12_gp29 [Streptomyces phage SF3]AKY02198.1 hypothetical protein SF1_490 [Streptomyces phage SF1]ALF00160.1 hypothetical protein SF3_290 [Streptomyces phage SF3]EFL00565.1 predicted protein [Streptomyces sp. SPB78]
MTTATTLVPLTALSAGLIASLDVRTWLDHTRDNRVFSPLLLSYPATRFGPVDPAEVEQQMLSVAAALDAAPASSGLPDVGERVTVRSGGMMLHFNDCPYALRLPQCHSQWAAAIQGLGRVLVIVGLDELSSTATRDEVDEYLEAAANGDRLYFGLATVTDKPYRGRSTQRLP